MKRLLPVLACACVLAILAPTSVSARHWWPHRSKSKAATTPKDTTKKTKAGREKHRDSGTEPLYSVPKSVGWWHKGPGPAGAGAK
jgi:hypothetical protein